MLEMYMRTDFRVIIFLKYIIIGGCDVIFWWTVWNIADYANPIHVPTNGHITFVYGYIFVLVANAIYLTTRKCFKKTLDKYHEVSKQELYPTSIVTMIKTRKQRTPKYLLISCLFPICVYFLALGFIHIWRGLFALFYYIVEDFLYSKGINMVLSRIVLQLSVGITLLFNQKNNTVNLCPTHKIFKFDELENLEKLFKMHILNFPSSTFNNNNNNNNENNNEDDIIKDNGVEEEIITNFNTSAEVLLPLTKPLDVPNIATTRTFNPLKHDFSSAMYFVTLMKRFHRSRRHCTVFPRKVYQNKTLPVKCCCSPTGHVRINIDILTMISRSCGINFIENVGLLSSDVTASVTPDNAPHKRKACLCMYVEIYQSKDTKDTDNINENQAIKGITSSNVKLIDNASPIATNCTCGSVIVKKFTRKITPHRPKEMDPQPLGEYHQIKATDNDSRAKTTPHHEHYSCKKNCLHCRVIHIFAYIYSIHYEHVFLNTFGAIFWCMTWGLFDTLTKPIFTNSAQDVPWFLLVAIMCHCLNHLVLFRVKETSVTVLSRTVCEYLCGINTVCFWASMWHVMDILSLLFSNRLLILILPHVIVFLSLSACKVSINIAL